MINYRIQRALDLFRRKMYLLLLHYHRKRSLKTSCAFFEGEQIIIVSYPRSGSSWFAKILSFCQNLTYIREPITQHYVDACLGNVLKEPQKKSFSNFYEIHTTNAISGLPNYKKNIINSLWDFVPWKFGKKRLLIKEVNPRALPLFLSYSNLRIILIVRHPAAIAHSYMKMGWFPDKHTGKKTKEPSLEQLEKFAFEYGRDINHAIRLSIQEKQISIVKYENFALEPDKYFRRIMNQLGLKPSKKFYRKFKTLTQFNNKSVGDFSINRDSKSQVIKWKVSLTGEQVAAIRKGYERSPFNYYLNNHDWMK